MNLLPDLQAVSILLLEDSDLDAELALAQLRKLDLPLRVDRAVDGASYREALARGGHDVILSDFSLPGFDGAAALTLARQQAPETPFIFVSGVLGEEFAIESLKDGATDYVLKQRLTRLPSAVTRALAEAELRRERRRADESRKLLLAELSHRVKNTLASVAAMARLTLKQSESLQAFDKAFTARLQALSQAHSLIFQADWGDTEFHDVVEQALKPFSNQRHGEILVEGAELKLSPKSALSLTLMLHELATNASKYGALSNGEGRVHLTWSVEPVGSGEVVRLVWTERGGPPVAPPTRKGFGRTLIERGARYELDGEARLSFESAGLEAELKFPADRAKAA